ncbi:MAG: hypothetical protein JSV49_01965, partial [Thermoplasmata archaeon]
MAKSFVKTKVVILISIFLISSFGLFVTGFNDLDDSSVEVYDIVDQKPVQKKSWTPPDYKVTSRATGPAPGSYIQNEGDPTYGYFLGLIDKGTFKSDASTLDDFFAQDDLATPDPTGKKKPVFPGSIDVVYDLIIESSMMRDNNASDGDEMLYDVDLWVDYNDVQLRNEEDWTWTNTATPFFEQDLVERNIVDTRAYNWIYNNLTIEGIPAPNFDPSYDHTTANHMVSNDNTIANASWWNDITESPGTTPVPVVRTAEAFNMTGDQYIDFSNDANLNDSSVVDADNALSKDLIKIETGKKTFAGFTLDVLPTAKAGVYRFKVHVSYEYQKYSPLPTEDEFSAEAGLPVGNIHDTSCYGRFEPYYWVPWNISDQKDVGNITQYVNDKEVYECTFHKYDTYKRTDGTKRGPLPTAKEQLDGYSSWEPIPDTSTNEGTFNRWSLQKYPDYDEDNYDDNAAGFPADPWDGYNAHYGFKFENGVWVAYPIHPTLPADRTASLADFQTNWDNNFHLDAGRWTSSTVPAGYPLADFDYNFISQDDNNGTWQSDGLNRDWFYAATGGTSYPPDSNNNQQSHAGWEKHFVTTSVEEEYWVQLRIFSGSTVTELDNGEFGLEMETTDASDAYVTDGDKFEPFNITISNGEYAHYSTSFDFNYTNLVGVLDIQPYEKYFEVYGGTDPTTGVARTSYISDSPKNLNFRINSQPDTPPGYYYFKLNLTYTKVYYVEKPTNDPRNDIVVDAFETIMTEFFVQFSPNLDITKADINPDAKPGMRAVNPQFTIDTGTNKSKIDFTIRNTGNVELIGDAQYIENPGPYDSKFGEVGMYVSGVEMLGQPFYEEDEINEANLYMDIEPIVIPLVGIGEEVTVEVPVMIRDNWDITPGDYRVHLNYRGFYFDPGNFTPASKYVYTEIIWDPDPANKDKAYVYRDTNDNGKIDIGTDAMDETDGIYTDITVEKFDPATRELGVNSIAIDGVQMGTK